MRGKPHRFHVAILALALLTAILTQPHATAASRTRLQEDEIKAGFIYNFLLFTKWPDTDTGAKTLRIGILGEDGVGAALLPLESMTVGNREVRLVRIEKDTSADLIRACDLVFFHASADDADRVLAILAGHPIVTVGEDPGFLEKGGMINLLQRGDSVKFEVNAVTAEGAGIRFRAKMLRLAIRVLSSTDIPGSDSGRQR